MQKIIPQLWFDHEAEEAARFYASLFPDAQIGRIVRYGAEGRDIHGQPEGRVMTVEFELAGYRLVALNGGPHFRFSPAISLFVILESEAEVDKLWHSLVEGGDVMMPLDSYDWSARYGWLSDRYGLSWQIMLGKREDVGQSITPSLLFVDGQHGRAKEATEFYTSVFDNSRIAGILHYDGSGVDPAGTVKHAQFYLEGEAFMAMDSALVHDFGFTEAISFMVCCETQAEIDRYWGALSAVPEAERCGWLKDRFGVSWQIVPSALADMMADPDRAKVDRVVQAFMQMKKLDIAALERAREGGTRGKAPAP
jgi:predicted 3-demethylubiquinone-9 3-methyltransferase (glyoxalase superfamily)